VLLEASGTVLLTVVVNKSLTLLLTAFTLVGCERTLLVVDEFLSVAVVEGRRVTGGFVAVGGRSVVETWRVCCRVAVSEEEVVTLVVESSFMV